MIMKKLVKMCAFSVTICATKADFEAMTTLLFIEDDESIRTALRLALEDDGFDVIEAVDGESGIAKFGQSQPDLVLLDLRLPDISGFEVCRALRRSSITPIIMVTAQTDTADLVNGLTQVLTITLQNRLCYESYWARIKAALRRSPTSAQPRTRQSFSYFNRRGFDKSSPQCCYSSWRGNRAHKN